MDTIKTLDQLQQLRLQGMANRYKDILDLPLQQQPEAHQMLAWLSEAESLYRNHQRTQLYLRMSKLRYHATLEQVHCPSGRGITQEQLLLLGDGMFIQKAENIILTGATGCGKSYLACALGRRACMLGYRTLYFSMNRFIEALAAARIDGSYIKWINQIAKTPLLILDDFGLQPLSHDMKLTLLQILEDRYAAGATIITSQLPFPNWYDYLDEPTLADAIMDRMSASAHKIQLTGQSLRNKKIT
jgi:DNA replication protein DnaC